MNALTKISALLLISVLSTSAHAALQKGNWKVANDNQVLIDTTSGLEWLTLNNTKGQSINDVLSKIGTGGTYAGWRLPTESEVLALTNQFYGSTYGYNQEDASYFTGNMYLPRVDARQNQFNNWYNMMGSTYFADGSNAYEGGYWYDAYSAGVYINPDPGVGSQSSQVLYSGMFTHRGGIQARDYMGAYVGYNAASWSLTTRGSSTGVFLVSDGGLTLSSQLNPSINQNNLAATNQLPRYSSTAVADLVTLDSATINLTYNGADYTGFSYRVNGGAVQNVTGNQITLTGLQAGSNYVIDYAAFNKNGTSNTWSQTNFTTQAAPVNAPLGFALFGLAAMFATRKKSKQSK